MYIIKMIDIYYSFVFIGGVRKPSYVGLGEYLLQKRAVVPSTNLFPAVRPRLYFSWFLGRKILITVLKLSFNFPL